MARLGEGAIGRRGGVQSAGVAWAATASAQQGCGERTTTAFAREQASSVAAGERAGDVARRRARDGSGTSNAAAGNRRGRTARACARGTHGDHAAGEGEGNTCPLIFVTHLGEF